MQNKVPEKDNQSRIVQEIIDGIPMVTLIVDNDIKILNANYSAKTFTGKSVSKIFDHLGGEALNCIRSFSGNGGCGKNEGCDLCIIRNSVSQTFRTGESIYRKEGTFRISDNGNPKTLDVLISTTSLHIDNKPVVLISIDDITDHKKALAEMKESKELFEFQANELSQLMKYIDEANDKLQSERDMIQAIFNASNIGIGITDQTGRYIMFNNWWTEHLGYSEEEMKLLKNTDITHPDYIKETLSLFKKLITGENNGYRIDKMFIRKDGSSFWGDLSVSVIRDKERDNSIALVIGIIRDITEYREATEALKKSEAALKEAQKIGNTSHWEYDLIERKLTWSDQSFKIFDIEPGSFLVTFENVHMLLDSVTRERYEEAFNESLKNKTEFHFEYSIVTASHKLRYLIEKAKISYDSKGIPVLAIGTITDITERKEIELNISNQNNRLKELNATKDKLFSIISHDLRNAFNAILGLTELLSCSYDDLSQADIKESIEGIKSTANSTYGLLENLLTWARSQQNKIAFKPVKTDLLLTATECLTIFENQVQIKGIVLENHMHENIILNADPDMIKTIIRNLVSNAIKFTPRGSKIEIIAEAKQGIAEITVKDSGVGMNKETKQSLFKITKTKSLDGTDGEKGTGLGLILCKEFVERHGGQIRVESEMGKGSSFMFTIPLFKH